MLDAPLRRLIDPALNTMGRLLIRMEIPPNALTMLGLCCALACFAALAMSFYTAALVLLLCNRLLDGLDGAAARASPDGATDFGGYIDILSDFIFYGGFVFFFSVGAPDTGVAAAFLLFSFMLSGGSFFAGAAIAEKRARQTDAGAADRGDKSFTYTRGLMEGSETIIAFTLICLLPSYFTVIAGLFGLLCLATAALRTRAAYKNFGASPMANAPLSSPDYE